MALTMDRCGTQRAARAARPAHLPCATPHRSVANVSQGRRLSNKKLRALLKHIPPTGAPALAQAPSRGTSVKTFAVAAAEVKTQVCRAAIARPVAARTAAAAKPCLQAAVRNDGNERLSLLQRVYLFGKSASQGDASMKVLVRAGRWG
jgi:hypothetical protein